MLAAIAPGNGDPRQATDPSSSSSGLQPLTRRDRSLAGNLLTSLAALGEEGWRAEVGGGSVGLCGVVWRDREGILSARRGPGPGEGPGQERSRR